MRVLRVPALRIHAVHAIQLQPSLLEMLAERAHHAAIFPLVEAPHRCREDEHARARMPEDEQVHLLPERRAVPATHFAMHQRLAGYRKCSIAGATSAHALSVCPAPWIS